MKKQCVIYAKGRTKTERIVGSICQLMFLLFCIWFSYSQGGGAWTFLTVSIFILSIYSIASNPAINISSKQEAVAWANSLQEDEKS